MQVITELSKASNGNASNNGTKVKASGNASNNGT